MPNHTKSHISAQNHDTNLMLLPILTKESNGRQLLKKMFAKIFQDGGQYGRQITPKAISQLINMIERQTLCRLICIHGPEIQWWHFHF